MFYTFLILMRVGNRPILEDTVGVAVLSSDGVKEFDILRVEHYDFSTMGRSLFCVQSFLLMFFLYPYLSITRIYTQIVTCFEAEKR